MSKHTITITGGSGLVGQIIRPGLKAEGHEVRVFDMYRGAAVDLLRHRFFATSRSAIALKFAHKIKHVAKKVERSLLDTPVIARRPDHILDMRSRLVDRFRGSDVVIHLAGIPHPGFRGASAPDFQTINYEGSVNVFEAAREAGVRKFVFASSAQVYMINKPTRIDQFPILETNHCPDLSEGQSNAGCGAEAGDAGAAVHVCGESLHQYVCGEFGGGIFTGHGG
jgi:nucleoside-diphosphate-sugar epimerase